MNINNFRPSASLENLRQRAKLLRHIRRFFDARGFVEVQTPVLSADAIVDRFVEPLEFHDETLPQTHRGDFRYFLQTSPEFAMKRLVASGMERIYQVGPVFRQGDRGPVHNIEFTMLEWYCMGQSYCQAMRFLAELVQDVAEEMGVPELAKQKISLQSFGDVFEEHVGRNPHLATSTEFRNVADAREIRYPASYAVATEDRDLWIDLLFGELVQHKLDAVILYDYPCSQSQLAQSRQEASVAVTERFELFLNRIELANGYHELLDAAELRNRFKKTRAQRMADGNKTLPIESRLLAAMEHGLPDCCGTALGIDRLLMVLLGAHTIDEVLAFPIERA